MTFISPLAGLIAAAITIPALVSLYFLKLRRKRMVIPSTLLWQRAVQDLQVNAPFQKIKNNLLLWIQLLLLIALLIAIARPTQNSLADPGRRIVIVIDHSASMNIADGKDGATRLEDAKRQALQLVENMAAGDEEAGGAGSAMVVSFAHRSQVIQDFTTNLVEVRRAINSIEPTDQRSHLDEAIAVIDPYARQGTSGDNALSVHILSDGKVQDATDEPLALVNAEVLYHRIGAEASDNLGIIGFSAGRVRGSPHLVQIFVKLANYSDEPIETNLSLYLDGSNMRTDQVKVPAMSPSEEGKKEEQPGTVDVIFDFAYSGSAALRVTHDHKDGLAADNSAWLLLAASRELRILMVTTGNVHIENAINAVGIKHLTTMTPDQYEAQDRALLRRGGWDDAAASGGSADEGFDVIIFDRYQPKEPALVNSLYFAATPPIEGFERVAASEGGPNNELITQWDRASGLLVNVELSDILLQRPGRLVVPNDGRVLAIGGEGPVMAELTRDGVRHVVVGFDVFESMWPLRISFPAFFLNALPSLGLDGDVNNAGIEYRTGESATFSTDQELDQVEYTGPTDVTGRPLGFSVTAGPFTRIGEYRTEADVSLRDATLAVNLLDKNESDTRVAGELQIGTSSVAGQTQAVEVRKELWPWFVWGAMALLAVEWLVYTRRMHL